MKIFVIYVYFFVVENFGFVKYCMFFFDCLGFVWGMLI